MPRSAPVSASAVEPSRPFSWRLVAQAVILMLAGVFVFAPALQGTWLWDDGILIKDSPLMHEAGGWWKFWFAPPGPEFLPLTSSVEWSLWRIFGNHTLPFHLTSLALHLLSGFLLWRLFMRLGMRLAWLGALLFVVHPVTVESVAWISELKNTLSMPLLLGVLLAWLNYDERERTLDYVAALLLFIAALLAKTSVVMLPFVLLLHAWWKYGAISMKKIIQATPFFTVALILGILTWYFQRHWAIGDGPIDAGSLPERAMGAGTVLLFYAGKFLWPANLMPAYPWWDFDSLSAINFLPWLLIVVVLGWLWLRRLTWGRTALFGLGFFILNLAPVLGFLTMSYMRISRVADHFAYVPIIGLIGLAVVAAGRVLDSLPKPSRTLTATVIAGLICILSWQSHIYAGVFHDQVALWSYTLRLNPDSWQVELNLGMTFTELERLPEAEAELRKSLALKNDTYTTHLALANVVAQLGRNEEAAREYETALKLFPDSIEAHINYGIVLLRLGDARGSERQYYLATLCPAQSETSLGDLASAHYNLACVMLQDGRRNEAITHLQAALEARPDLAVAHDLLQKLQPQQLSSPK